LLHIHCMIEHVYIYVICPEWSKSMSKKVWSPITVRRLPQNPFDVFHPLLHKLKLLFIRAQGRRIKHEIGKGDLWRWWKWHWIDSDASFAAMTLELTFWNRLISSISPSMTMSVVALSSDVTIFTLTCRPKGEWGIH